jgi:hypothetical protein
MNARTGLAGEFWVCQAFVIDVWSVFSFFGVTQDLEAPGSTDWIQIL